MASGPLMSRDDACGARISAIDEGSCAYMAGFEPGCVITHVNGEPLRDMIDWLWHSCDDVMELGYIDLDGEEGTVELSREPGKDWGITFDGAVFDGVHTCVNACTFCFMRQLPKGMRKSLSVRDDDFRLAFLEGTFCTFTNAADEDLDRIIEQHISPLRVSLHAADPNVRRRLIGKNAARGMRALERLLGAGIDFDAQIVLVPGENDGEVLAETLNWAYAHPGIANVGIVPLGYTSFQDRFDHSFDDPKDALSVLEQIAPFQKRALAERGNPWVYAADELYCNAYGDEVLSHIPDASFYGDFSMFEDGIGIVRSAVDSWNEAERVGAINSLARILRRRAMRVSYICGESMRGYANGLVSKTGLDGLFEFAFIKNRFFGGNVDVTGLLCAEDIVLAIGECEDARIFAIPDVVFNDDGLTLDGCTLDDIKCRIGKDSARNVVSVASNPLDYIPQIRDLLISRDGQ